ncbi:hypothetical protein [Mesorhizobium marinum]|uniref:hypothetical protein n=1 Tax=Mesorhizobium marinum TaxID=3228790 RepID=UPI003465A55D
MTDEGDAHIRCKFDISWRLIRQFSLWYRRLGAMGTIPFTFGGVTSDHRQVSIILSGLPFDEIAQREFLIWLCREEDIAAYVHGAHVVSSRPSETPTEGLMLHASSILFNICEMQKIRRDEQGHIEYSVPKFYAADADGDDRQTVFHQLQRDDHAFSREASQHYSQVWQHIRDKCLWLDLRTTAH